MFYRQLYVTRALLAILEKKSSRPMVPPWCSHCFEGCLGVCKVNHNQELLSTLWLHVSETKHWFDPSDADLPLATIAPALKISRQNAIAYVNVDEDVVSSAPETDEAIQAAASSDVQEEKDESDSVTEILTYSQIMNFLVIFRQGLVNIANPGPSVNTAWKVLAALESCLSQAHTRSVQKPVTDYFES